MTDDLPSFISGMQHIEERKMRSDIRHAENSFGPFVPNSEPDFSLIKDDGISPPSLPDGALPATVMEYCLQTAEAVGSSVDYVVGALLTGASGWLGNARRVQATYDWIEPPHLWMALIGAPSSGKTPAINPVVSISRTLEDDSESDWKDILSAYERDTERSKASRQKWQDEVKESVNRKVVAPNMPADAVAPPPPVRPRVLITDATVQEIGNMLAGNSKGLLQIRDELAGWLGGMDQYSGQGADRAFFLEAWNGGGFTIDRVKHSGEPIKIRYASIALLGGMQPDKLREALTTADDGLGARLFYIWPDPAPYKPLAASTPEQLARSRQRQETVLRAARRLRSLQMEQNDGHLVPKIIPLSKDAATSFEDIRRKNKEQHEYDLGLSCGWYGKLPGRVLRLAVVMEYLAWAFGEDGVPEPQDVSLDSMICAWDYMVYASGMFERAMAGIQLGEADSDAVIVARHLIKGKVTKLNERALYQTPGFHFLRDKGRRQAAFGVLLEAGFIYPASKTTSGRPKGDWLVNPRIYEARS